jgi:aminoglycoside 3-N-acetyltransferase
MATYDYTKEDLIHAFHEIGIKKGEIVFTHVGMGFLGYPKEGKTLRKMFKVIYQAFEEVLGKSGTLLVPVYTYSFCNKEPFNVQNSSSTVGYFTEQFRKLPTVVRSVEPIFSVAGKGPAVKKLFKGLPDECFGKDCIYDRLVKAGGYICNVGVGFRYATFVHYAERSSGVSYRYNKVFEGEIVDGSKEYHKKMTYYVRNAVNDKSTFPDLLRLERDATHFGDLTSTQVGRGRVTRISCKDLLKLCRQGIKKNPWYLARGFNS